MKKIILATASATALLALSACGGDADTADGDDMAVEGDDMAEGDGDAMASEGDTMADGDSMGDADAGDEAAAEDGEAAADARDDESADASDAGESGGSGNGISLSRDGVTVEAEGHSANVNLDGDVTVD